MKKTSILALTACLFAALCLALVGCGGQQSDAAKTDDAAKTEEAAKTDTAAAGKYTLVTDGTLTCISETGFAPFEYIDVTSGSTDPVGYDIDVANEVAKRLNLKCVFLPSQDFDTLLPTIKDGNKADIAIAGITINPEREEVVDFTDPYYDSNLALVVKKDSAETLESLNNVEKKVACQTGTTGEDWIKEKLTEATRVPLPEVAAGLGGVQTGLYDAYIIDLPVAQKNLADSYADLAIKENIPTGEQFGIGVSKNNPELTKAINGVLADMKADGTMQKIYDKWMINTEVPAEQ